MGITLEQVEVLSTAIQAVLGKCGGPIHVKKWIILCDLVEILGID